jgi:hypothetical protein
MESSRACVAVALLAVVGSALAQAPDWDAVLDEQTGKAVFVVVGRITKVVSNERIGPGKYRSVGIIEIRRHLKGNADVKTIEVEFPVDMKLDEEDVVWFIGKKLANGRYSFAGWKWGVESLSMILPSISRTDKTTRIPGMPKPAAGKEPLTVVLGIDDGTGRALESTRATSFGGIRLMVQFENRGSAPQAVMPVLDGCEVHWRFPHYDLEIRDAQGMQPPRQGVGRCGNVNHLRTSDIVSLQPGEVFRTTGPWGRPNVPPGHYRVRLAYTAKRDTTTKGILIQENEKGVEEAMRSVWEGTIHSNWIDIEILPKE